MANSLTKIHSYIAVLIKTNPWNIWCTFRDNELWISPLSRDHNIIYCMTLHPVWPFTMMLHFLVNIFFTIARISIHSLNCPGAHFLKAPETLRACNDIFSWSESTCKHREVYTPTWCFQFCYGITGLKSFGGFQEIGPWYRKRGIHSNAIQQNKFKFLCLAKCLLFPRNQKQQKQQFISVFPYKYMVLPTKVLERKKKLYN